MQQKEIFHLHDLFEAVQMKKVFADGKTFPDCIARYPLAEIEKKYIAQKEKTDFDLTRFVYENFEVPVPPQSNYQTEEKDVAQHINNLWAVLTRRADNIISSVNMGRDGTSSLIPLPHPYVVPGGRFGEIYYWDSYFTMLGLQVSGKVEMIQNMVDNFAYLIDQVGYIPNGNRSYFLGRSQPPFFSLMVKLLAEEKDESVLVKYLPQLEKEDLFWNKGTLDLYNKTQCAERSVRMPDNSLLTRYWDKNDTPRPESYREDIELAYYADDKETVYRNIRAAAESGWDFSCRWFRNIKDFSSVHTTDIVPVDLNCLLYHLEKTLAETYALCGQHSLSKSLFALCEERKESIQKYCWSPTRQFYFDYDFVEDKQKEVYTLAALFPLFFNISTSAQANRVAQVVERVFLKDGGLTTTLETTGQQWDAPNGWAPLQWIAIKGLENYGFHDLAKNIAQRWIKLNKTVFERTGKMMEKYNVYNTNLDAGGGEYPSQDGFGWSNGVLLKLIHIYEEK